MNPEKLKKLQAEVDKSRGKGNTILFLHVFFCSFQCRKAHTSIYQLLFYFIYYNNKFMDFADFVMICTIRLVSDCAFEIFSKYFLNNAINAQKFKVFSEKKPLKFLMRIILIACFAFVGKMQFIKKINLIRFRY
jgi:hypothetical protein